MRGALDEPREAPTEPAPPVRNVARRAWIAGWWVFKRLKRSAKRLKRSEKRLRRRLTRTQARWSKRWSRKRLLRRRRNKGNLFEQTLGYGVLGLELAGLGGTPWAKVKLFVVSLTILLKARVPMLQDRLVRLQIEHAGRRFRCTLSEWSELEVMHEVFCEGAYALPSDEDPRVIVDLGSNIGLSIMFFRARYPHAQIFGFEPDPQTFLKLRANMENLEGVRIFDNAVAGQDGFEPFLSSQQSYASSLLDAGGHPEARPVLTKSLDTVMTDLELAGIDLLKIDTEGAEFATLQRFRRLGSVKTVIGEFHGDLLGKDPEEFLALLDGFIVDVEGKPGRRRVTFTARRSDDRG